MEGRDVSRRGWLSTCAAAIGTIIWRPVATEDAQVIKGQISGYRRWSRCLSNDEINALRDGAQYPFDNRPSLLIGLKECWNFEEAVGEI